MIAVLDSIGKVTVYQFMVLDTNRVELRKSRLFPRPLAVLITLTPTL
jgi:hypothetical protein